MHLILGFQSRDVWEFEWGSTRGVEKSKWRSAMLALSQLSSMHLT